jgi:hypothetical protein
MENTKRPKKTEEVQHIIDKMPTKFGTWVTLIVIFIIGSAFFLGWFVTYHDVVIGRITINADNAPVRLIANYSGKIRLLQHSKSTVKEGQYIAYIQSSADVNDVIDLKKTLEILRIGNDREILQNKDLLFSKNYSLGELNVAYYKFLNAINMIVNYHVDGIYAKQEQSFKRVIFEYDRMLKSVLLKSNYVKQNSSLYKKFYNRDSALLSKKVISEQEFNTSELRYLDALSSKEKHHYEVSQLIQQIENVNHQLQQLSIEKNEKLTQLKLELVSSYSELKDNIKAWEEKYVFVSPIGGKVQFLKFWVNNQFIQSGEQAFTIVAGDNKVYGQVNLPNMGAGKVRFGQEVVIKLDNYPYMEYGSLEGKVKEISLTAHSEKTQEGENNTYLVHVELPNNLTTSYGKVINNAHEVKGSAEIITSRRRLIQRMFDNLKYLLNN